MIFSLNAMLSYSLDWYDRKSLLGTGLSSKALQKITLKAIKPYARVPF
ncbi:hypothetical protein [Acinetobacter pullicarnis]|nr:hypothetical protein [Acinetobacter pullicarnis]